MTGLVQTMLLLFMVALVVGQPGLIIPPDNQAPPAFGTIPFPGDSVLFPPTMPGDGFVVPPLIPGIGIIPPLIPGIGIDLPKRKCAAPCAVQCLRSRRNRLASKLCIKACMLRCGIRISDVVYGCTENCANSISPNLISGILINLITSCFFLFVHIL